MFTNVPNHAFVTFLLISGITLFFFLKLLVTPLIRKARTKIAWIISLGIIVWLVTQSVLAYSGFYSASFDLPPRGIFLIMPPLVATITLLIFLWKSNYFKQLSLETMTHIHVFRFPLELIVLTALASAGKIPDIMTFNGNNPDIIVGITAPIIAYLYFIKKSISINILLAWHILSLLLLINISSIAILSLPYPFQQFGLDQPNIAVFHLPYVLLPSLLVGVSYFCHIISIHKILVFGKDYTRDG